MTNERIRKIAHAAMLQLRREKKASGKPMEGPFYLLWLKPNWKIVATPHDTTGDVGYLHPDIWERACVPILGKHYNLEVDDLHELAIAAYGMPRGRVVFNPDTKKFTVFHGNDIPSKVKSRFQKDVMNEFNLVPTYLNDHDSVKFKYDEHEIIQPIDKEIVESVLGKVPYK